MAPHFTGHRTAFGIFPESRRVCTYADLWQSNVPKYNINNRNEFDHLVTRVKDDMKSVVHLRSVVVFTLIGCETEGTGLICSYPGQ